MVTPVMQIEKMEDSVISPVKLFSGSAGYDLLAHWVYDWKTGEFSQRLPVILLPGKKVLIGTGLKIAIHAGYFGAIRPRSGLGIRHEIEVFHGTIDSGYTGEIMVLVKNEGDDPFLIDQKTKIAQIIFIPFGSFNFEEVEKLPETPRGEGGFGSTDKS